MKNHVSNNNASSFQEWANFITVLNNSKNSDKPLLKKAASVYRMVNHLDKQLPK